jgi:hypothetical protein
MLGVIGHPCSRCRITIPEVAIGTAGIEGASLRIEEGLQHMLEHILRDHSVMLPLSISPFEGDIVHLDSNGQKATKETLCSVCFIRVASDRFPIVMYIGHAFLSQEKFMRWVASHMNIIGTSVSLTGSVVYTIVSILKGIRWKLTCLSHHQSPVCISL